MKIAYDIKKMRPGCAIVQAHFGCDPHISHEFDTKYWLLAPTEDMKVYPVTEDQLRQLVAMTKERAVL